MNYKTYLIADLIDEIAMGPFGSNIKVECFVDAFIDKKRAQGKPYYVYMTAGANKFLRIYYGRVKEYLMSLPE